VTTFTLSPKVKEFLRTGISGYVLVLPASAPVPEGLPSHIRVERDDRIQDGCFFLVPENVGGKWLKNGGYKELQ